MASNPKFEAALLRLLADEASVGEIRERAQLLGGSATGALEDALRIRESISELRRREVELSALNDSALDLVSMRTMREVLDAIVRRARTLLGADASYLTLVQRMDDVDGEELLRVTNGIAHSEFRDLHAMGLGQRVLQTGGPWATSDYFADDRFDHDGRVDAVVEQEGLRAILGVPVSVRDTKLGVLSVAVRTRRTFVRDDVALLSAFASLAAAAIENARLFEESARALAEVNRTKAVIRSHAEDLETIASVHESLTQLALDGSGLQEVADAIARWTNCDIIIEDSTGNEIAATGKRADHSSDAYVLPIVAGGRRLGTMSASSDFGLGTVRNQTLERASQTIALLLLNEQAATESEQRRREELIHHVLSHDPEASHNPCQRVARFGLDLEKEYRVAAVSIEDVDREEIMAACGWLSRRSGVLAAVHDEFLVVVSPSPGLDGSILRTEIGRVWRGAVTAVYSSPTSGLRSLKPTLAEATRTLRLAMALGRIGEVIEPEDLGLYRFLFANAEAADLNRFVDDAIGPVFRYDVEHGAHLVATLEAWFANAMMLAAVSKSLHIHVNTLYKRLERLDEILGEGWRNGDGSLRIQLALRLHQLQR